MAFAVYFPVKNMSQEQYDQVHAQLDAIGQGEPDGRTIHCGFRVDDRIEVFDVYESMEAFQAFGEHLMPILAEHGIDPGEPMIHEVALLKTQG